MVESATSARVEKYDGEQQWKGQSELTLEMRPNKSYDFAEVALSWAQLFFFVFSHVMYSKEFFVALSVLTTLFCNVFDRMWLSLGGEISVR